jgi:hypothetical protein
MRAKSDDDMILQLRDLSACRPVNASCGVLASQLLRRVFKRAS